MIGIGRAGQRAIGIGALALVSLSVGLIVAEGIARLALPAWQPRANPRALFFAHHPTLGWANRPGQRGRFTGPSWDVTVEINTRGLRGSEHDYERSDETPRRLLPVVPQCAEPFDLVFQPGISIQKRAVGSAVQ